MKIIKSFALSVITILSLGFATASFAGDKDIVTIASGADNLKTLVKAVKAAGLVDTLKGKGPFTVFAPSDEAFAKLPEKMQKKLLSPASDKYKNALAKILTYHVVSGKVASADIAGKKNVCKNS